MKAWYEYVILRVLYAKVYLPIDNWRWSRRINKRYKKAWKDFEKRTTPSIPQEKSKEGQAMMVNHPWICPITGNYCKFFRSDEFCNICPSTNKTNATVKP